MLVSGMTFALQGGMLQGFMAKKITTPAVNVINKKDIITVKPSVVSNQRPSNYPEYCNDFFTVPSADAWNKALVAKALDNQLKALPITMKDLSYSFGDSLGGENVLFYANAVKYSASYYDYDLGIHFYDFNKAHNYVLCLSAKAFSSNYLFPSTFLNSSSGTVFVPNPVFEYDTAQFQGDEQKIKEYLGIVDGVKAYPMWKKLPNNSKVSYVLRHRVYWPDEIGLLKTPFSFIVVEVDSDMKAVGRSSLYWADVAWNALQEKFELVQSGEYSTW